MHNNALLYIVYAILNFLQLKPYLRLCVEGAPLKHASLDALRWIVLFFKGNKIYTFFRCVTIIVGNKYTLIVNKTVSEMYV